MFIQPLSKLCKSLSLCWKKSIQVSQTQEDTVSKSGENLLLLNTPCSLEAVVYHLEATEIIAAINVVATLYHYLILGLKFVIVY